MPQQLLLVAGLHDRRNAGDEVCCLLADLGTLVVEAPLDGATYLRAGKQSN
jgi:hypothetical protein